MRSATPKIFLDSNIWFSAFYHSQNCEKLIKAYKNKRVRVVISQQVLEESTRNIREKIPHQLSSFQNLILNNPPEIVTDPDTIPPKIKNLISDEDQPIFISAIMAKVNYFITGNIKDFHVKKLEKITGIKILTPKEIVSLLDL